MRLPVRIFIGYKVCTSGAAYFFADEIRNGGCRQAQQLQELSHYILSPKNP